MCNIDEEEPVQHTPRGKGDKNGRTCMKCSKAEAVVVVRLNDPLCKNCFMTYFIHKFRATIGKARVIRHGDKVLLGVSGGPCSLAMLKLVCEGVSENAAKRFRFRPSVVFIDEGALLDLDDLERINIKEEITAFVSKNGGFDFYVVNLEDLYKEDIMTGHSDDSKEPSCTSPIAKLKCCFDSLKSLTAKEDLLKSLRKQLLIKVALREGYPKVMMGDCSSRISVRILSNIAQGRGDALPFDTSFVDSRHDNVTILRPMREFVAKEISLYNFFQGIEAISIPTLATKSDSYSSIDRLTEEFVGGLQAQFQFTVNTIFRTGDKLTLKDNFQSGQQCLLCGVPSALPEEDNLFNKFENVQLVEKGKEAGTKDGQLSLKKGSSVSSCAASGKGTHSQKISARSLSGSGIIKQLCYGCALTLKDMKAGFDVLPSFVTEPAAKELEQAEIKEQIGEFLLEG